MRQLSIEETQVIEDQLNNLNISFVEIYNELLDHYTTALKEVSSENFASSKEILDHEFTWSAVRKMEKELLKNVSVQFQKPQLESLKFWKLGLGKLLIIFVYTDFLLAASLFVSLDMFILFSFIPALCIMVVLLYQSGNYSLSLDPNYHRPRRVIFQVALAKYALAFNFFLFFFAIASLLLNNHITDLWSMILTIGYSTVHNLYVLSILNSIHLKTSRVIKSKTALI